MDDKAYSFKKLFILYTLGFSPFLLIGALLTTLGSAPVHFNDKVYYGIKGGLIYLTYIPLSGFFLGLFSWIFLNLGRFIHSLLLKAGKKN